MPYCINCGEKIPEDAAFCPNCGTPVKKRIIKGYEVADWGERFIAWIIDMILLGLVLAPFKWRFTFIWLPAFGIPHYMRFIPFTDVGFDNFIYFLYWTVMEGLYGQSIGKMAMKLKVVRLNGERIDMGHALVESIGKAFLLPIDCLIGWILYSDKKQRLFNYISDTMVVKIRR